MAERGGVSVEIANTRLVPNYASFYGESLMPPSDEGKRLTPQEFQEQFPVRYDIWNALSQGMLGHSETGVSLNNPDTIQRLKTRLHILNRLDRYITAHHSDEAERTLRERQITVFEDIRDHLEQGETTGYIKLPTGSGKTVIFTEVAEATDLKTLIVVPRQLLVDQTAKRFQQFAPNMEVGKVYAEKKERGRQVEITTYESMVSGIAKGLIDPKEYGLVVLDEVHKGLTQPRQDAIGQFTNAIKLGFTATPNYSETRKVGNVLGKEIHTMSVREAVEEGMLSPFSVYLVRTNTDISNVKVTSSGDYDQDELEKAINNKERNIAAVQTYQALMKDPNNQGQLSIAYCAGVQHAKDLANEFQQAGVAAGVVYNGQSKIERRQILKDYETGKIKVLCNAKLLIEGFDEPKTGIILNVAPTASLVDAEQRGGRGLRLDEDNSNKHAIIVDIVDQTSNRRFLPITFAQVVDGAYILPRNSSSSTNGRSYATTPTEINIEGMQVITDPEEVMRITQMLIDVRTLSYAPEGWMIMGDQQQQDTLVYLVGKNSNWIKKNLSQILAEIEKEQDEEGVPEEDREPLFGYYINKNGKELIHYHPSLLAKLQERTKLIESIPEGWIVMGTLTRTNTLSYITKRTKPWIDKRLSSILEKISQEQDEEGVPEEDREPLFGEYIGENGHPATYYAPIVLERLQELAKSSEKAPEGWVVMGNIKDAGTLAGLVEKTHVWVKARLPQILAEIEREQDEQDIPEEERKPVVGDYLSENGQDSTYYAPIVVEKLQKLAKSSEKAPEGWMIVGSPDQKDTLSSTLGKSKNWVNARVPKIIATIQQEWDVQGIPPENRRILSQNYTSDTGRTLTFYAPIVIDRLKRFAEE